MQTTARCTESEKLLVEKTAMSKGTDISRFINHALKVNLPLSEAPIFDKSVDRNSHRIGLTLNTEMSDKINDNIVTLDSDLKKVRRWEIILFCALKECE